MGSYFLGLLEAQAKLLSAAADIMGPLGAYKEVGKGLNDSPSSSVVKEATVGWLAAAQVSHCSLDCSLEQGGEEEERGESFIFTCRLLVCAVKVV